MPEVPAASSPQPSAGPRAAADAGDPPKRIGLIVHPSRSVEEPLRLLQEWTESHRVEVVQLPASYSQPRVARDGEPGTSDLIVSIGGDGTTLAALRTAVAAHRPVLGIACGSLGALATVSVRDVTRSLERFSRGEWEPRPVPGLAITRDGTEPLFALNDVAIVRAGGGQVRVTAHVDASLYARIAGDGAVVSTPIGSSGYAVSAGGPLLGVGMEGFVFTPLPKHGGFAPPLVLPPRCVLQLDVAAGFGGARLELDGQIAGDRVRSLTVRFREGMATMVSFRDQETLLAGLRRRRIIVDSPRVAANDARGQACP